MVAARARVRRLRRLVDEALAEAKLRDAGVARRAARAAHDVGCAEDLVLGGALERVELLLVGLREFAQFVLEQL